MKRFWLGLCGVSLAGLLCSTAALADTFNFNFSGAGFTGSGTFTASPTATAGQYMIDSVTGTTNGVNIAGILAPGIYPPAGDLPNDNYLFYPLVNGGALDIKGFSYNTTAGADYNIYYYDGVYSLATGFGPSNNPLNIPTYDLSSFTITDTTTGVPIVGGPGGPGGTAATPEPGSLVLLATGVLGMAGAMRRRIVV